MKNGWEYGLDDDGDRDEQCDAFWGMWRIGLDGADRCGLNPPSLSLQELLGGVGGNGNESMFTEIKINWFYSLEKSFYKTVWTDFFSLVSKLPSP